jgi:hypothetical protein
MMKTEVLTHLGFLRDLMLSQGFKIITRPVTTKAVLTSDNMG